MTRVEGLTGFTNQGSGFPFRCEAGRTLKAGTVSLLPSGVHFEKNTRAEVTGRCSSLLPSGVQLGNNT